MIPDIKSTKLLRFYRFRNQTYHCPSHIRRHLEITTVLIAISHQQNRLREHVDLCQMLYEFADDDDVFMRDFAGSYLPGRLGRKLLTFMCHIDYAQRPVTGNAAHCCPLYTFCPQKRRKEKPEQCSTQPWLAWDDQPQYGWCEYALGVGYMSGYEQPRAKLRKKTV